MKVVLYTGGLDSFIGLWLLEEHSPDNWEPVYFDLHTQYSWKELAAVRRSGIRIVKDMIDVRQLESEKDYIPQRNALLCIAAQAVYDDALTDIALCSVADDVYADNTIAFHLAMSRLLTQTTGHEVSVFSPLQMEDNIFGIHPLMTKAEAVERYLYLGGSAEGLRKTVSCYDAVEIACGRCEACRRHEEAMKIIY